MLGEVGVEQFDLRLSARDQLSREGEGAVEVSNT